jgi:hypothetical protein
MYIIYMHKTRNPDQKTIIVRWTVILRRWYILSIFYVNDQFKLIVAHALEVEEFLEGCLSLSRMVPMGASRLFDCRLCQFE